jgi:hypothetical protein
VSSARHRTRQPVATGRGRAAACSVPLPR